jgi:MarR family
VDSRQLRTPPSRLVPLVDHLEGRGLIERRRNPGDRRHHALYLAAAGRQFMKARLAPIGIEHEDDICAALSTAERDQLHELLSRIAEQQGLAAGRNPVQHARPRLHAAGSSGQAGRGQGPGGGGWGSGLAPSGRRPSKMRARYLRHRPGGASGT